MVLKQPCCKVFTFFFSIGFDLTLIGMGFCVVGCGLIYMMEYCVGAVLIHVLYFVIVKIKL